MSTIDITDAVEAAARAQYDRATSRQPDARPWADCTEAERTVYRSAVRPHVEAAAPVIAARSLQDAATAFRTTRPVDSVRLSLEYPAVELQAMAYRCAQAPAPARSPSAPSTQHPVRRSTLRRVRGVLGAAHS